MPLTRWQVSTRDTIADPIENAIVNVLYFNVTPVDIGQDPNYQTLGDDLWTIMAARSWNAGRFMDIRAYNMDEPGTKQNPREQKYLRTGTVAGTGVTGAHQVSVALSYYADRNLASKRGRIYTGPWSATANQVSAFQQNAVLALAPALANLGGINVDWSLYSPKNNTHTRITNAWVDSSWDIIRKRKLKATNPRVTWEGDG